MPSYIVKPDRDRDLYVEWSTIVEDVTWVGTRDEALRYLCQEFGRRSDPEARLQRADDMGSSAQWPALNEPIYGWDDKELICEQQLLQRSDLAEYALALSEDRTEDAQALLQPIEDD